MNLGFIAVGPRSRRPSALSISFPTAAYTGKFNISPCGKIFDANAGPYRHRGRRWETADICLCRHKFRTVSSEALENADETDLIHSRKILCVFGQVDGHANNCKGSWFVRRWMPDRCERGHTIRQIQADALKTPLCVEQGPFGSILNGTVDELALVIVADAPGKVYHVPDRQRIRSKCAGCSTYRSNDLSAWREDG
jgi:hypothetical protein